MVLGHSKLVINLCLQGNKGPQAMSALLDDDFWILLHPYIHFLGRMFALVGVDLLLFQSNATHHFVKGIADDLCVV